MPSHIFSEAYNYSENKVNNHYASYSVWIEWFNENLVGQWTAKGKRDGDRILAITLDCKCGGRIVAKTIKMKQHKNVKTFAIKKDRNVVFSLTRSRCCSLTCGKMTFVMVSSNMALNF